MTWRCLLSTSSYLRTFLRISAFCALDLRLRALDLPGDHLGLDGHVLRDVEAVHDRLDGAGSEAAHQLVLQRQVEAGLARVALAAGAAAELVVDAAGVVALGAQDVEPADVDDLLGLAVARLLDAGHDVLQRLLVMRSLPRSLLAWLLAQDGVTCPIIGPRTMAQLDGASLRALEISLTPDTVTAIDAIFPGPGGTAPEAYAW